MSKYNVVMEASNYFFVIISLLDNSIISSLIVLKE